MVSWSITRKAREDAVRTAAYLLAVRADETGLAVALGDITDMAHALLLRNEVVPLTPEQARDVYADLSRDVRALLRRAPGTSDAYVVPQRALERVAERKVTE